MSKKIVFFLSLSVLSLLIFLACKKEPSCETCVDNKLPVAIAGRDTTILLPLDSLILDGSLSYDPDGVIRNYSWSNIGLSFSINNAQAVRPILKNFIAGIYKIELTVTDDKGAMAKDTLTIIASNSNTPNRPPIASAGLDKTITLPTNTILLNGSSSSDPDNNIAGFSWTKISGPSSFNISDSNAAQTQVTSLVEGIYQFKLTVTDIVGLSSKDTVRITVNAAPSNRPPIADAGLDRIITLPANSITLNGVGSFDPDNNPIIFSWSKISGPAAYNISSNNTVQTTITNLVAGVYHFKLTVTDNGGLSDGDTVQITVNPPGPPNEVIIDSLTWGLWHDENDSVGMFDEIGLAIYDTTNMLYYTPISIFVKLDSVGTWVQANPIVTNTNCTPPYTFIISPTASPTTMVLFILSCPLNFNLIGTGASVKIIY